jgi:hypothetical protein
MRSANEDGLSSGPGKGRIEALRDGVFAIAMTLLVLDLKPPRIESGRESVELLPMIPWRGDPKVLRGIAEDPELRVLEYP